MDLDGSKGVQMSFRPWDGQLRQRVLLTDGQGVIAFAPMDGILHPKNTLGHPGQRRPRKALQGPPVSPAFRARP